MFLNYSMCVGGTPKPAFLGLLPQLLRHACGQPSSLGGAKQELGWLPAKGFNALINSQKIIFKSWGLLRQRLHPLKGNVIWGRFFRFVYNSAF